MGRFRVGRCRGAVSSGHLVVLDWCSCRGLVYWSGVVVQSGVKTIFDTRQKRPVNMSFTQMLARLKQRISKTRPNDPGGKPLIISSPTHAKRPPRP